MTYRCFHVWLLSFIRFLLCMYMPQFIRFPTEIRALINQNSGIERSQPERLSSRWIFTCSLLSPNPYAALLPFRSGRSGDRVPHR